jgi:hypothetical protein
MSMLEIRTPITADTPQCSAGSNVTDLDARSPVVSQNSDDVFMGSNIKVSEIRAAWDQYREGSELPLGDAFLFAAGFLAGRNSKMAKPKELEPEDSK